MHRIVVFAGLGSDSLFSSTTLNTAKEDGRLPESRIILLAAHENFRNEISRAVQRGILRADEINLDDFKEPETLIQPPAEYHHNPIIQHVTLYLVQILRYIRCFRSSDEVHLHSVTGFCAGLLAAAVVATSTDNIEFLSRANNFFYVALILGIRCQVYRRNEILKTPCSPSLPWSIIVDGLLVDRIYDLINEKTAFLTQEAIQPTNRFPVHVSAINTPTCVTLSGKGDQLRQFIGENITSECRVRTTNIFTLYHSREKLLDLYHETVKDLQSSVPILWSTCASLRTPLISTTDGKLWTSFSKESSKLSCGRIAEWVLEMILLEPVDWVAVQSSIVAEAKLAVPENSEECEILNFGPGYGMSKTSHLLPDNVYIIDASAAGNYNPPDQSQGLSLNDLAIVGMAIDFPGAPDIDKLWEKLSNGENSCAEIPSSRFYIDDFYHKKDQKGNRHNRSLNTRYGNFLENPFLFDNGLFEISPREANSMDPQQRVMLQTAYRSLENAGYVPDSTPSFARDTFGCFIGNATIDYTENLREDIDVYYSPGTLRAFQSGRISYVFGWSGPSITLDTACSSSMVALHQASRALLANDCRAALVGGVNVITSPDMYLGLDRAHFLSPSGQCKAFDASADGYCRSEGCGAFVVKKLGDALAEDDRILAVIRGIEANQSGNAHSITHPHVPTQEQLFNSLFRKTKIHPHKVTVVETHGTGTQAGDPNEVQALRKAICEGRDPQNLLHLTSIKANIGHCEAASGAAALAKVILMMKYGMIPPQISLQTLNPKIQNLGSDGAVIDRNGALWNRQSGHPRTALINNFGAAGSNVGLILQEYKAEERPQETSSFSQQRSYTLGFSAKKKEVLVSLRDALVSALAAESIQGDLRDICYTLTARRQLYDHRISVTASSIPQLVERLEHVQPDVISKSQNDQAEAVFVFSGQGSQYLGMGRELMHIYPSFAKVIYQCDNLLKESGFPGCLQIIDPDKHAIESVDEISILQAFQSAIFALEVALAKLLISWNIVPTAVLGHSLGEYAALVIADVLDLPSGVLLVARRAQLMMQLCELRLTSMLAVNLAPTDVLHAIDNDERYDKLEIACCNGRTDCVVGGPRTQLQNLKEHLATTRQVKSKMLDVPMAYHTSAMDPMLEELTLYANTVNISKPRIPIVSNVLGRTVQPGENAFTQEYFSKHCRETVQFDVGVQHFLSTKAGHSTPRWVEVGPHPSLLPLLATRLDKTKTTLLPCLRKDVLPSNTISQLLSHFYQNTIGIHWRHTFDSYTKPQLIDLPGMPFIQEEFGVHYPHETEDATRSLQEMLPVHRNANIFISSTVQSSSVDGNYSAIYEIPIQLLKDLIEGHIVCDHALCPASVYHEIALSAVRDIEVDTNDDFVWFLSNISYVSPLLYNTTSTSLVRIFMTRDDATMGYMFTVSSYSQGSDPIHGTVHCKGSIKRKLRKSVEQKYSRRALQLEQKIQFMSKNASLLAQDIFLTKAMYEKVFTRVVTYSELYQKVESIRVSHEANEAIAVCRFPAFIGDHPIDSPTGESIFMDVLLHVAGFVANLAIGNEEACICVEVSSASVLRQPRRAGEQFYVHCVIMESSPEKIIIADAQAVDAQGVMAIYKGMVFQRIELAKVRQAFQIASRRIQQSSDASHQGGIQRTQLNPSSKETAAAKPVSVPSLSIGTAIKDLVAKTCSSNPASIFADSSLEALGIDSLMMMELESQLLEFNPQVTISALSQCKTVGDIETICGHKETHEPAPARVVAFQGSDTEDSIPTPPDQSILARTIIAETCGANAHSITSSSELQALGIDSLMIFELESRLLEICQSRHLSSSELSGCRTVGDVEKLIERNHNVPKLYSSEGYKSPNSSASSNMTSTALTTIHTPITPFSDSEGAPDLLIIEKISRAFRLGEQPEIVQPSGSSVMHANGIRSPLFLFHDGSGICIQYHRLFPLQRPVYALHDPKFLDRQEGWSDLAAMANHYVSEVLRTCRGPYILGGWSFGGVVAFEVARRLLASNHSVVGVVLIDSPPPLNHQPLSDRIIEAVTGGGNYSGNETKKAVYKLTTRSFAACAKMLGAFTPDMGIYPATPRLYLLRSNEGWEFPSMPEEIENPWLQDRSNPRTAVSGWESLTKSNVLMRDIPGDHFGVFDAKNISEVSAAVQHACDELEERYRSSSG